MKPCRLLLLPEAAASCATAQLFYLSPFAVKPITASLPMARVSHFVSIEEDPIAESGQMFLPDHPDCYPQYDQIQQPPKQRKPGKRSRK